MDVTPLSGVIKSATNPNKPTGTTWIHSQIQQTRLTHILYLCTRRTDLRLFEPRSGSGIPSKDGEGSGTDFAFSTEVLFGLGGGSGGDGRREKEREGRREGWR